MKRLLSIVFSLALGAGILPAQDNADTGVSPDKELSQWEKDFLNLPEDRRNDFKKHVVKSRELFNQKRVFECIEELGKAKAIFPDSPDVENMLGACQVEFRAFDNAMTHFNRAIELEPKSASVLFNIAEILFVTKEWEDAEKAFEELIVAIDAEDKEGRQLMMRRLVEFKLLLTKIKLGKMDEAEKMAERYDHLDDSPYPYYAEAAIAYENEENLQAEMAMARAERIFRNPASIAPWKDTMMEFGYIKSFFGGDLAEEAE
ncbi:MAG: tetratricopeptide repeat protein [Verrucomicrobiota bacterium]